MYDFFYFKEHLFIVSELLRENLYEFGKFIREAGDEPYFTLPNLKKIARQILEALDFVLVDGHYRQACIHTVLDRINPGGMLVVDDWHFLPGPAWGVPTRWPVVCAATSASGNHSSIPSVKKSASAASAPPA